MHMYMHMYMCMYMYKQNWDGKLQIFMVHVHVYTLYM